MHDDELLQGLIIELRRGTLALVVLSCLRKSQYGYSLLQDMENKGIRVEANTLYPMLRRLETQGLLVSNWDTAENRPRKYYTLSDKGNALYGKLYEEWRRMSAETDKILEEKKI